MGESGLTIGLNRLEFYVNCGAIALEWIERESDSGKIARISRIDWSLKFLTDRFDGEVPANIQAVADRLTRYFTHGAPIGSIPWNDLDQNQWTPFQKQVYEAISDIPHGETRTYGWVAQRVGKVSATRAVGQALRNNPYPVLIPCHRVVSVTSIGGFMGIIDPSRPEMDLKRRLQGIELDYLNPLFPFMSLGGAIPGVAH